MKTTAALLEKALQIVDEVGAGQAPSAEDTQLALDALVSLIAELNKRSVLYLDVSPEDTQQERIPDELFNALGNLLAVDLVPVFKGGRVPDDEREAMINRLRRLTYVGPSGELSQNEYF